MIIDIFIIFFTFIFAALTAGVFVKIYYMSEREEDQARPVTFYSLSALLILMLVANIVPLSLSSIAAQYLIKDIVSWLT